jgi:hypothetical protein
VWTTKSVAWRLFLRVARAAKKYLKVVRWGNNPASRCVFVWRSLTASVVADSNVVRE